MRKPLDPAPGPRSVLPGEVLTLREAGRRLGLAKQALCDAQRAGLRTVTIGRAKFVTGDWIRQFAERLAQQQADQAAGNGNGNGEHGCDY
jgi:hypothetical protein